MYEKLTFEIEDAWEYLEEYVGVENETLRCVTAINGYNYETMLDILYYYTGYHSFECCLAEQGSFGCWDDIEFIYE